MSSSEAMKITASGKIMSTTKLPTPTGSSASLFQSSLENAGFTKGFRFKVESGAPVLLLFVVIIPLCFLSFGFLNVVLGVVCEASLHAGVKNRRMVEKKDARQEEHVMDAIT